MDPELRGGLEGREMELFIIEETAEFDDEEVQYLTPILLDAKTGERITIDNFDGDESESESESDTASEAEDEADSEPEKAATADGGTQAASTSDDSATESTETTESPDNTEAADEATSVSDESGDDTESNADDFEEIDDLLDYFARTDGEVEPDELREFSEDEVDDPDSIDWEAAAAEVERRA
jgi:hypothetical protein